MIIDATGVVLLPGRNGQDCLGNGLQRNEKGEIIECCCDECNYMICCTELFDPQKCETCSARECPRNKKHNSEQAEKETVDGIELVF
ncbi:MAG: hypothetical protein J6J13_05330 [Clostridia bacterium]|nr:hypothetical protein [Clostridia bacterium]MBP3706648.1 hypothetical protein [Clostridia bacterium]